MLRKAVIAITLLASALAADEGARTLADIAHDRAVREMGAKEWERYVRDAKAKFEDWEKDNPSGCLKTFLDCKSLILAIPARNGAPEDLKAFMHWVALYKELDEKLPGWLEFDEKKTRGIDEMINGAPWEKVCEKMKDCDKCQKAEEPRAEPRPQPIAQPKAVIQSPPEAIEGTSHVKLSEVISVLQSLKAEKGDRDVSVYISLDAVKRQ